MSIPTWAKWLAVATMLITTIVLPLLLFEAEANALVEQLVTWSRDQPMLAAAVLVLTLTSDVLFPVPNGIINTTAGALFGWTGGALVIWVGLTLGCLVGYGVGRLAGQSLAYRLIGAADMERARAFSERMGRATLVVTRAVPMFGDLATLAAGITRYPFNRYVLITGLANAGVAVVFAGIGSTASETESELLAILGALVLPLLAWFVYRAKAKGGGE